MHLRPHLILSAALVLLTISAASAQTAISEPKCKLIGELISVTKMDTQMQQLTDSVLAEMEKTFPLTYSSMIDSRTDIGPAEKQRLKASEKESFVSFSQKFRSRLAETIDYKKYIEETIYPIYDKIYTEQELEDLVAFYSTPTGQKVLQTLPQLLVESQNAAREKLLPQVMTIIKELTKEELGKMGAPPAPKFRN
jgi:hypothetical protein